jgi:hypothetical protein
MRERSPAVAEAMGAKEVRGKFATANPSFGGSEVREKLIVDG